MEKALTILAMLEAHLPDIKQRLGEDWSAFVAEIQPQAALFEELRQALSGADEAALADIGETLDNAANQLLGYFVANETACDILTQPEATETTLSKRFFLLGQPDSAESQPEPPVTVELAAGIANRFILLCRQPDEAIARGPIPLTQASPTSAKAEPKQDKRT